MTPDTHTPPNFALRLAQVLGIPAGRVQVAEDFWAAQAKAEGGLAHWNPLNTTYPLPGAWLYNTAGVRNYAKPIDGICATALTVANGFYDGILGALQGGNLSALQIAQAHRDEISKWGTNPDLVISILEGG